MKSIFWKAVPAGSSVQDAGFVKSLLDGVMKEVGKLAVVAEIVSDNMRNAWGAIEESEPIIGIGCAAHTMNLLLKDIEKSVGVFEVKDDVLEVVRFTRALLHKFKELQKELISIYHRRSALLLPVLTRWYSVSACFKSIVSSRPLLEELFATPNHTDFLARYETTAKAKARLKKVKSIVVDRKREFWSHVIGAIDFMQPMIDNIRRLESDSCPPSHVYKVFRDIIFNEDFKSERPKELLERTDQEYENAPELATWLEFTENESTDAIVLKLVWDRWLFAHNTAFAVAFLLDPMMDPKEFVLDDRETAVLGACAFAKKAGILKKNKVDEETFKETLESMVQERMRWDDARRLRHKNPHSYWALYCPKKFDVLKDLAAIIFAIPPTNTSNERAWSIFRAIQTDKRGRLSQLTLERLAFVYINHSTQDLDDITDPTDVAQEMAEFLEETDEEDLE